MCVCVCAEHQIYPDANFSTCRGAPHEPSPLAVYPIPHSFSCSHFQLKLYYQNKYFLYDKEILRFLTPHSKLSRRLAHGNLGRLTLQCAGILGFIVGFSRELEGKGAGECQDTPELRSSRTPEPGVLLQALPLFSGGSNIQGKSG